MVLEFAEFVKAVVWDIVHRLFLVPWDFAEAFEMKHWTFLRDTCLLALVDWRKMLEDKKMLKKGRKLKLRLRIK